MQLKNKIMSIIKKWTPIMEMYNINKNYFDKVSNYMENLNNEYNTKYYSTLSGNGMGICNINTNYIINEKDDYLLQLNLIIISKIKNLDKIIFIDTPKFTIPNIVIPEINNYQYSEVKKFKCNSDIKIELNDIQNNISILKPIINYINNYIKLSYICYIYKVIENFKFENDRKKLIITSRMNFYEK